MTCTLIHGDCLDELDNLILDGIKVDLVLIDPPYNINKEKGWDNRKKEEYIEFMGEVFTKANTILGDNGTFIWFHSEMPLIAELMMWISNNLPTFCYNSFIVCDKGDFRALSWKNPTDKNNLRSWFNTCEYILVYTKGDELYRSVDKTGWDRVRLDVNNFQNLRKYAYDMLCYIGGEECMKENKLKKIWDTEKQNISSIARRKLMKEMGGVIDHFTRYGSSQWSLPTKEVYDELTEQYNLRDWVSFREYEDLRQEYEDLRQEYEDLRPVHNLDENHNNVWDFKRDKGENYHSCQKPIDILERLIQVHSKKGATVLDCFMGSGSTGVACLQTNRNFIGIELDEKYYNIAKKRCGVYQSKLG